MSKKIVGIMLAAVFTVALTGIGMATNDLTSSSICTRSKILGETNWSRRSTSYKLTSNRYG